jgi:hypothetical protein
MQYTVITLVDGDRVATNRFVLVEHLAYHTGLIGVDLIEFEHSLKTTGQAMHVQRDADGVTVVIAHEEI